MRRSRSGRGGSEPLVAILLCLLGICLAQTNPAQAQSGLDLEGKPVNPFAAGPGKIVVLVFLRRDCPICGRYAPVIQNVSAKHERDASFWLVYPDKTDTPAEILKYQHDFGYRLPALRDPEHALVKLAQAEITPEAAVFDANQHLVYHGRIDDWYAEFGRSRPVPTTHELSDAIDAALSGKPMVHTAVKGIGCYISDLK